MASKEPFLPIPTEEDPESVLGPVQIPTAATYTAPGTGVPPPTATLVQSGFGSGSASNSTYGGFMSVETGNETWGEDFQRSSEYHTLCCGCCCDFRRAVLIVNAISISMRLLVMMGVVIGVSYLKNNLEDIEDELDDDAVRTQIDSAFTSGKVAGFEILFEFVETVGVFLCACGIYGALKFKKWGVITAGSLYGMQLFLGIISGDIGNIIVSGLFLYAHVCMAQLMTKGIMTPNNYHKVASCCGDKHM